MYAPWTNFENIMLNQRASSQKATHYMSLLTWNGQNGQTTETECSQGGGKTSMKHLLIDTGLRRSGENLLKLVKIY